MRKLMMMGAMFFAIIAQAQLMEIRIKDGEKDKVSPVVRDKIEEYSLKIDSLIQTNKNRLEQEIDEAELKLESGEITNDQFAEQKEAIAERYAQKMDAELQQYQKELEAIIQKQVQLSVAYDQPAQVEEEPKDPEHGKRISQGALHFTYGLAGVAEDWDLGSTNDSDFRFGASRVLDIGWKNKTKFSHTSPFSINYGFGFLWRTYRVADNQFIDLDANGNTVFTEALEDLDHSKFRTAYFYFPLELEFAFGKVHTFDDGFRWRSHDSSFRIGIGGYAGIKLNQRRIIKFGDDKNKTREDFNLNNFMYGLRFSVSKNWLTFYMRKDLSPLFDEDRFNSPINNPVEFGVSIELF